LVDAEGIDADVEQAGGLDGVGVEGGLGVLHLDDARGLGDRFDRADFVVDVHDADERRLGGYRVLQFSEIDEPLPIDAEVGDSKPLLLEALGGV
jgi:hypothetical protein